jgi:hypothetical protein
MAAPLIFVVALRLPERVGISLLFARGVKPTSNREILLAESVGIL